MLKLILGPAGSGKTSYITNAIRSKVVAGEGSIVMIVPEQYSFEAERELCAVCGDSLSLYAEVLSFSRLAVRVFQEVGTGGRISLDNGGRLLCMSLAVNQLGSKLKLYKSAKNKSELQLSLLQTVTELKTACISSDDLYRAAELADPGLSDKLCDLALCLEAYEAILSQGHADPSDRLIRLANTIEKSSLIKNGSIYVDGFTDFTAAEMLVLKSLFKVCPSITVCLTCDDIYGNSEHFEASRKAANALLRLASECDIETGITNINTKPQKTAPLLFFDEKLYSYTSDVHDNLNNCIRIIKADNLRTECEMAASKCIELVRETGCRYRDIAVAVRGFSSYSATLDEAFRFYGVPLFIAKTGSILQKPIPALIASAFEIIQGGWDEDAVLSYLKTGLTGLSQEDCDVLENYITLWSVRGSMWTRKKPWKQHPTGFGIEFDDESRDLLERINMLKGSLSAPLIDLSEKGKLANTATEQAKVLSDFLMFIKLPETLDRKAADLSKKGLDLLSAEYVQLWDIIVNSLEQSAAILGETPMTQEQFSKLFLQTLSQYDVSVIPVSSDSVSAGDMDRMRRRHIKHLIILGASDDRLPQIQAGSGLFSAEERDELNGLGITLGGGTDELSRELTLIYNCITLPSDTLTISYSSYDASGAQSRPSFLITRAKLLFCLEEEVFDLSKARLQSYTPAFSLAANALNGENENAKIAYAYFSGYETENNKLNTLNELAKLRRGSLSSEAVTALYGEKLRLSPSRTDAYFSCQFSYFLRYGLKLNEKERAGFEAPELGSFVHYVLENTAREISKASGFKKTDAEMIKLTVDQYIGFYIAEKLNDFEDKSPRFVYLFNRLRPSVHRIVADMVRELSKSDFEPLDFELDFMSGGSLPPVHLSDGNNELFINGIADRVDGYFHDDKLYLRIIDYKTGKKSFSLTDIWYGMGLQMLLYLFALEQEGKERYNAEIVPAGVLYIPAKDSIISASGDMPDEELAKEKTKTLKRSGLILDNLEIIRAMENSESPEYIPVNFKKDGSIDSENTADSEKFKALHAHVDRRLLELSENLRNGNIDAVPYYKGEQENACLYCPYVSVCRFDEVQDKRHYLSKVKQNDFWRMLEDKNE